MSKRPELLNIVIHCDNAAFEDDWGAEVARILRDLADRIESSRPAIVRDFNGNTVGTCVIR